MHVKPLRSLLVPIATLSGLAIALPALGHGTAVEYEVGTAVAVSALYDTGEPMVQAQVAVFAPNDPTTPWMTGTTDLEGNFLFMPDPAVPGKWEVQVRQAGHGDIVVIAMDAAMPSESSEDSAIGNTLGEPVSEEVEVAEAIAPEVAPASPQRSPAQLSPVQRWTMIGAIIWGFVGTAFFFAPRKSVSNSTGEA